RGAVHHGARPRRLDPGCDLLQPPRRRHDGARPELRRGGPRPGADHRGPWRTSTATLPGGGRMSGPLLSLDEDGGGGHRPVAEINVTPFVDVMLVLLIVFMVTAP